MSMNRDIDGPTPESDEFDWRWVGEPESWMALRSERSMTLRPSSGLLAAEPRAGRFAARLVRSFLSLFRG